MSKKTVLDNRSYSIKKNSIALIKPHSISFDMNKCVRLEYVTYPPESEYRTV